MNIYWSQRWPKIMNDYNLVFRLLDISISDANYFLIDVLLSNCHMFRMQNISNTFVYALENYMYMNKMVRLLIEEVIKKYNLTWIFTTKEYMRIQASTKHYVEQCFASHNSPEKLLGQLSNK